MKRSKCAKIVALISSNLVGSVVCNIKTKDSPAHVIVMVNPILSVPSQLLKTSVSKHLLWVTLVLLVGILVPKIIEK